MNFATLQNRYDNLTADYQDVDFNAEESEIREEIENMIIEGITDTLTHENGDVELFTDSDNMVVDEEFAYLVEEMVG